MGEWIEIDKEQLLGTWRCRACDLEVKSLLGGTPCHCGPPMFLVSVCVKVHSEPITGKTLLDLAEKLLAGKTIRRPSWATQFVLRNKGYQLSLVDTFINRHYDYHLTLNDLTATDWEVVDGG